MNILDFKWLSVGVLLSAGLWGCAGNAPKTEVTEVGAAADTAPAVASMPEPGKASIEAPVVAPVEEEPADVEVIPAEQAGEISIAVESMPAKEKPEEKPEPQKAVVEPAHMAEPASEVVEPAAPPASAAAEKMVGSTKAVPAGPNHHVIALMLKDSRHPAYGKGHPMGFSIDGVPGKSLVLERGKTYTFEIHTNPKHDVYLSKKPIGWGSAPIVEGVQGAYVYDGVMTFTPGKTTPDKVYYACRNHPYMGATLYIVDPGEQAVIEERAAPAPVTPSAPAKTQVSEAKVKQKLMFAEMMINGQSAKRVMASSNEAAKALMVEAKRNIASSREKLLAGALPESLALADKALKAVGEASRMVPSEDAKAQQAKRFEELKHEIADFESSYANNYKRLTKAGKVPKDLAYDKGKVAALKAEAEALAGSGDYVKANAKLEEAQADVTMALHKMLDSQTLVYDLKFETAADEFDYELKRFTGYEELIPVAVEMKKPAPGALKLMDSFVEKARKRRDEAMQKAEEGDYGAAIGMMQQATKTVRRALRMVGVTQ